MLAQYYIGDLVASKPATANGTATANGNGTATANGTAAAAPPADPLVVLTGRAKVKLPLVERIELNRNTRIFRFGLPSPEHRIGGWCRARYDTNDTVVRTSWLPC